MARKKASQPEPVVAPTSAYTVLARRYRPQTFADLVGQEAIARALTNAIETNRVAHAYLFTGARGVGKTSTARILAKALNCATGPTPTPCDKCEICQSITSGEDVDVLEIDGASNNRVDEVRELRQNVGFRPTRSRYKIYIIDEVHMLTREAFNALLKTLEEPPEHVKFIFATTEVQKIPLTILSRCQRFDFAGIGVARIVSRLENIVTAERKEAERDALELIARRAGGSMRDAQSLLDQLLAFGGQRLTVDQVHQLLGTAHDERVLALASAILERDPARALTLLGEAADLGLQLGEFLDQLIEYWRDLLLANCAGSDFAYLQLPVRHRETLARQAAAVGTDTLLAGLDVLATCKARLRTTGNVRVLLEMAIVRLCRLEDLLSLAQVSQMLGRSNTGMPQAEAQPRGPSLASAAAQGGLRGLAAESTLAEAQKKKEPEPVSTALGTTKSLSEKGSDPLPSPVYPHQIEPITRDNARGQTPFRTDSKMPLCPESLPEIWKAVVQEVGGILGSTLETAGRPAILAPNMLVISFGSQYNSERQTCDRPGSVQRIEDALRKVTGQDCKIRIQSIPPNPSGGGEPDRTELERPDSKIKRSQVAAGKEPLIQRIMEVLGAQYFGVDEGFGSLPRESNEESVNADTEER